MADITVQTAAISGVALSLRAAAAGDAIPVAAGERVALLVNNGSASPVTVTVAEQDAAVTVPGKGPVTLTDRAITVAAGAMKLIGPFGSHDIDGATGRVEISYSATADVTVTAIKMGAPA